MPVFHDDQHGTAIISTAAILNGLRVVEKNISDVRMVVSGAGAAAIACMNLLVALGLQKHNIVVCDSKGVIYQGHRPNMAETKAAYAAVDDGKRTLDDVIEGADIFLGIVRPESADPGNGEENGSCANDPGAGEPGTGNSAAAGERSASGCHHLHRSVSTIRTR
ncbi:malic enzyme-like NAD(P)-binding protein [Escherichia coli]